MNKKGDYKYDVALALILGLLIVALVFYFLYAKYFTQEDIDWQTCSQSVTIRGGNFRDIVKDAQEASFPFKCKTEVVEINFKDKEKAGKLIMDTMAQCKSLFSDSEGNPKNLYSLDLIGDKSRCFHCARVHFTDDVKDYYGPDFELPQEKYEEAVNYANSKSDVQEKYEKQEEAYNLWYEESAPYKEAAEAYAQALEVLRDNQNEAEKENLEKQVEEAKKAFDESQDEYKKNEIQLTALKTNSDALTQEYVKLRESYIEEFLGGETKIFNWRFYLDEPMDETGITYGQYIYGFDKESTYILSDDAFSSSKVPSEISKFTKNVIYSTFFNPEDGDLIITVLYTKGTFFDKNSYSLIIPHQTSQSIICSKTETIPA